MNAAALIPRAGIGKVTAAATCIPITDLCGRSDTPFRVPLAAPPGCRHVPAPRSTKAVHVPHMATGIPSDLRRLPISLNRQGVSVLEGVRAALSVAVIIAIDQVVDWPPLRDAQLLKTVYAFGLRRTEVVMLDTVDLHHNAKMRQWGRYGAIHVRWAKAAGGGAPRRRTAWPAAVASARAAGRACRRRRGAGSARGTAPCRRRPRPATDAGTRSSS